MNKKEDKWLDKWDAKIMWWFYDILENELDVTMAHDSTELRKMLKKARKELKKELVEKIDGMRIKKSKNGLPWGIVYIESFNKYLDQLKSIIEEA